MLGTGSFALPTFEALYGTAHEVCALVTQPDRSGRGHHNHPHPMKEAALARDTPVLQPESINAPDSVRALRELRPDLFVVAAYGQILSSEVIEVPRLGAINVHASLLPKYRGAAPIQYAILRGETETGITIFQLEPKLDAGPILGVVRTPIDPHETAGDLEARLSKLAVPLTLEVIDSIAGGRVEAIPQNPQQVTRAPRIKKEAGAIDWSQSAEQIGWHVRAMQPWPKAFTFLEQAGGDKLRLIVLEVAPSEVSIEGPPGSLCDVDHKELHVKTKTGPLEIVRLQPEGKRPMTAAEFLCGHAVHEGDRFTSLR